MADKRLPSPKLYGADEAAARKGIESLFASVYGKDSKKDAENAAAQTAAAWSDAFFAKLKDQYKKYEGVEKDEWEKSVKSAIERAKERAKRETEAYFQERETTYENAEKGFKSASAEAGYATSKALGTARVEDRTKLDIKALQGDDAAPAREMLSSSVEYVKALRAANLPEAEFKAKVSEGLGQQIADIQNITYFSESTKAKLLGEIGKLQAGIQAESFKDKFATALKGQAKQGLADAVKNLPGMGIADFIGQMMGKGKLSDRLAGGYDIRGRGEREQAIANAQAGLAGGMGAGSQIAAATGDTKARLLGQNLDVAGKRGEAALERLGTIKKINADKAFYKKLSSPERYKGPDTLTSTTPVSTADRARELAQDAAADRARELAQDAATPPATVGDTDLQNTLESLNTYTGEMSETLRMIHEFLTEDSGLKRILSETKGEGGDEGGGLGDAAMDLATSRRGRRGLGRILRRGGNLGNLASRATGLGSRLGGLGGVAKVGGRLLGKAALPLTAAMAAYDAYKGFNADPNLGFGGKLWNATKSAASGATFGLSEYVTGGVTTGTPPTTQPQPDSGSEEQNEDALKFGGASGSKQNFDKLEPNFKARVVRAANEYYDSTKKPLVINSAARNPADGQRLWDESVKAGRPGRGPSGMPIARPGMSRHERGIAIDIQNYNDPKAVAALNKQGLVQGVPGDPVHFQMGASSPGEVAANVPSGSSPAVAGGGSTSPTQMASTSTERKVGGVVERNGQAVPLSPEEGAKVDTAGNMAMAMGNPDPLASRAATSVASGTSTLASQQSVASAAPIVMGLQGAQAAATPPIMQPIPIPIRPRNDDRMLESLRAVNLV